jgi:hypothetical protein
MSHVIDFMVPSCEHKTSFRSDLVHYEEKAAKDLSIETTSETAMVLGVLTESADYHINRGNRRSDSLANLFLEGATVSSIHVMKTGVYLEFCCSRRDTRRLGFPF